MERGNAAILALTLALGSCVARDSRVATTPPSTSPVAAFPSPAPAPEPLPPAPGPLAAAQSSPAPTSAGVDAFQAQVRPVLARTCAPCHNPGGRMYDRLPFDNPQVVRDHPEGILRRLKGADKDAVAAWLAAGSGN